MKFFASNRDMGSTGKAPTQAPFQPDEQSRKQEIEIVVRDVSSSWACSWLPMQLHCPVPEMSLILIDSIDYLIFSSVGSCTNELFHGHY